MKKQIGQFTIQMDQKLGSGAFGDVFIAHDTSNNSPYAVKVINAKTLVDPVYEQVFKNELEILKNLKHKNLIGYHQIKQTKNSYYLFIEFCNGGTLKQYLQKKENKRLSEQEARSFFKQILNGYQELHEKKYIHRDLKPENILLHNGEIKIGDFGFGRLIQGDMNKVDKLTRKYTPLYGSPQILQGAPFSYQCDIYSMGVLLYEMLCGNWPFSAKNESELARKIKAKDFKFDSSIQITEEMKNLVSRMLEFEEGNPQTKTGRILLEDIFKHPAVTNSLQIDLSVQPQDQGDSIGASMFKQNKRAVDDFVTQVPAANNNRIQALITVESPKNIDQLRKESQEEQVEIIMDNKNSQMEDFTQKQNALLTAQIMNKKIIFLKNSASLANFFCQKLWEQKNQLQFIPQNHFYSIFICIFNYYVELIKDLYIKIVSPNVSDILIAPDMVIYLKSQFFEQTQQNIIKEYRDTQELANIVYLQLNQYFDANSKSPEIANLKNFLKETVGKNLESYQSYVKSILVKSKEIIIKNLPLVNIQNLKSLYYTIVFAHFKNNIQITEFSTFDFSAYYQSISSRTQQEYVNSIQSILQSLQSSQVSLKQ